MTVKFATQVPINLTSLFNKIICIFFFNSSYFRNEYCREDLELEQFKNTEATEAMVRLLNYAFNVKNVCHIQESICKETGNQNARYVWLNTPAISEVLCLREYYFQLFLDAQ